MLLPLVQRETIFCDFLFASKVANSSFKREQILGVRVAPINFLNVSFMINQVHENKPVRKILIYAVHES